MTQQNWGFPGPGGNQQPQQGDGATPPWQFGSAQPPSWSGPLPQPGQVPWAAQGAWQPPASWPAPQPTWAPPTGAPVQSAWQSPPPGQFRPQPPRRSNPLGALLRTALVLGALFFAGFVVVGMLSPGTNSAGGSTSGGATTRPGTTTTPGPEEPYTAPEPDMNPPALPLPDTYSQATDWMKSNAVYDQSIAIPNGCSFLKPIDSAAASVKALQAHLNELTACLSKVWTAPVTEAGYLLPRPPATVYTTSINTSCGRLDKVNASYCGGDQRIYYSAEIPKIFPARLQHTPFLMDLVLAHEFGHTIQARTGISVAEVAWEQKVSAREARVLSRRLEQQADCFAGMFTQTVAPSQGLSERDLANLREVAYNLGDDVLSGNASIDSGHGLGKNRQAWYTKGLTGGPTIAQCNTFVASASSVR